MSVRLGIVMDPIAGINPKKDSSFALLLAAQQREWQIFYMEPADLFLDNSIPRANMYPLEVRDHPTHWFDLGIPKVQALNQLDVILMRLDPPVNQVYLHVSQLLSLVEAAGIRVINRPQALRDYNEKLFALEFPQCCPPSLVTQSAKAARQFLSQYQDVVVKPLDGMGGQAIFRLREDDPNKGVVFETLKAREERYFLIQRYLPEIQAGDKRVLMINGEPVSHGLARLPAQGETRANLAAGGQGVAMALTDRDRWICQQVAPRLRENGLFFVGLDIIGEYLTEINITNPTCIRELEAQCGVKISDQLLGCLCLE